MEQLPAAYFAELARQVAFVAAVLGGFAATFFGTLLAVDSPKRVVGWAMGSAALAAACFICTTFAATFLATAVHPEAPAYVAADAMENAPRVVMALSLLLGLYALFAAIGAGGWIRSRAVGIATTGAALFGGIVATWAFMGF